ncbi:MAG TPA: tetratricopeptide repeat protein [Candidatus Hydrogenedens sp.]|nr:tetratricopeptide repeat protein [Candidatus Hydrogenedens sp.]HPP59615.1 tetratricopeptide repeat protein [Candidatus Hydrogenedens sp.]
MPIRRQKKRKTEVKDIMPNMEEPKNQLLLWWAHIKENIYLYSFSVLFILLCVIIGGFYGSYKSSKTKDVMTKYASAVLKEDLQERLDALKPLLDINAPLSAEILYVYGETAMALGKLDEAENVWKKLCDKYPQSEWVPNAREGLGYLEELRKNYDNAINIYKEIKEKWSNSYIAKRQSFNIARVLEAKEDLKGAIEEYKKQQEEFPDSSIANKAKSALEKIKTEHPELFPEEKKEEETQQGTTKDEVKENTGNLETQKTVSEPVESSSQQEQQ